jgi:putative MATE family efflux protein
MLSGNATLVLLFLGNAIFRGAGNPAMALYVLLAANGINIILDPCLIFGLGPFPELGVTGAAVATNFGRGVGVFLQLWLLFRSDHLIRLARRHVRVVPAVIQRILFLSMGGIIQFVIATTSWIFLVRYVAAFGSEAVAGYGIAIRIMVFTILPAWGISNAAATLVGQNLGAGKVARASRSVWLTGGLNMVFLFAVMLVFLALGPRLVAIFTDDALVLAEGALCLRVVSYGFVFYALGMVLTQSFNGSGDTWTPTGINFFCYWMVQLPAVHFLSPLLGTEGIYLCIAGAETLLTVVSAIVFKLGYWKKRHV